MYTETFENTVKYSTISSSHSGHNAESLACPQFNFIISLTSTLPPFLFYIPVPTTTTSCCYWTLSDKFLSQKPSTWSLFCLVCHSHDTYWFTYLGIFWMPSSQWSFPLSLYFKIITFPGPLIICIPFLLYFSTLLHSSGHITPYIFILFIVYLPQPVCNLHEDNRVLVWMFVLFCFSLFWC